MHKIFLSVFSGILLSASLLLGDSPSGSKAALTQVSTVNALLAGEYDGVMRIDELRKYGNFGVGTVDRIDGELVLLDGIPYAAKEDGRLVVLPAEETVPFAAVLPFDRDTALREEIAKTVSREELEREVARILPNSNLFSAILFEGEFQFVAARSEKGQLKPYRPLAETMKTAEVSFTFKECRGTMVGTFIPEFMKGLNVPGYHWHFVSEDRSFGEHVTDFQALSGEISILQLNRFQMILPDLEGSEISTDRSQELEEVER